MQSRLLSRLGAGLLLLLILAGLGQCALPELAAPLPSTAAPVAASAPPEAAAPTPLMGVSSPTQPPSPTVAPSPTPAPISIIAASPTPTPAPILPLRSRFPSRPGDRVVELTPGVVHIQRATADPLRINMLLFDLTAPEFDLRPAIGDGWLIGRTRTSALARQNGALAAVNGDLFSGDGLPQGLMIMNGRVVTAPKYRATFAWSRARGPFIGYFTSEWTWQAEVVATDGARAPLYLLNTPCPADSICLFNHYSRRLPARSGAVSVALDADGVVQRIVREQALRIPRGTQVLQGVGQRAAWLLANLTVGDRVTLNITTDPPLSDYTQAISGGPIILQNGEFVQDCLCALRDCRATSVQGLTCEDFTTDWKLHHYLWVRMPRTGIGFDQHRQTLIVAVVDGYQRGYSRGITQEEFAALFREMGADAAMELDGGGSSTMVVRNQVVNRPADGTGERYIANALLFFWNADRPADRPRPALPLPGQLAQVE